MKNLKTKAINSDFYNNFSWRLLNCARCHCVQYQLILEAASGLQEHMTVGEGGGGSVGGLPTELRFAKIHNLPPSKADRFVPGIDRVHVVSSAKCATNPKMRKCYRQLG
jgi:hypothetical protein